MNKKSFFLILTAAAVILTSILTFSRSQNPANSPPALTGSEERDEFSTLIIDWGNGEKSTFSQEPTEGSTAFGILKMASEKNGLSLETQQYDFGVFVKSINGYESTAEKAWIYFVNGESGAIAADKYILKPEDVVEWKYIAPSGN